MVDYAALFRLLGDSARLRMLHVLGRERLNVSELVAILGIAQSGVSRHLRLLKSGGLIDEERDGTWAFYQARAEASSGTIGRALAELAEDGKFRDDEARMKEVLRARADKAPTRPEGSLVPGRSWAAWARGLGCLLPRLRVADLGCGSGRLAIEIASWADWVVGVDHDEEALKRARRRSKHRAVGNVRWRDGDVENLPLADASVDVALLSQVLHCLEDPAAALAEARRILAPGGRVLVLDLRRHDETWVRARLGHIRLGFTPAELRKLLRDAGFDHIRVRHGDGTRAAPFKVVIADGRVPKVKNTKSPSPIEDRSRD
jgi:SAM-dependent methyltransferase